ncbi:response regulator [Sporanaerobium hydrogeniformans]|uniref:response regulator n=1 Tax=Sporanaerobium hydrogeniformans TaxID=3072179 RepID=UPI0015D4C73B|nr:response regulator [Sporanaerobium hydrogeniformans]
MYKVLLVEDEVLVREAIAENIAWEEMGLTLLAACKNGKEAIEVIEGEVPDIVLTDICMPFVDGMQLSKYLFENHPQTKIIIFSGYDEFEYAKQALQYKVEEYLLKPVTAAELTELLVAISKELDKQRQEKNNIKKLRSSYYKHLPTIRSQVLNDLILGNKSEEEYREEMKESEIYLSKRYFKVAFIDSKETDFSQFKMEDNQNQSALLTFAIYNIVDEIITQDHLGVAFQQKDNRSIIIFESNLNQEFEKQVKQICKHIQDKMKAHLGVETIIGIGEKVDKLNKIYISYRGAYEATRYSYLCGYNCILSQEEIKTYKEPIDLSKNIEEVLLQVKKQSEEGIRLELDKIVKKIQATYLQKEEILIIMQKMILRANELLKLAGVETENIKNNDENWLTQFKQQKTVDEAFAITNSYLIEIMGQIYSLKEDMSKKQTLLALDYIEKNYQNSELTLQDICSYLTMSPSYFSATFKRETGETFIEVLTKKRIEKAKNMLKNTSLKNYEIAEKVGFSDPHYFSITFKKYTGKTPKEYAKESRDEL